MLRLSDMQLAPRVLPITVTVSTHQRWMPVSPKRSGSQPRMGLELLSTRREKCGKRLGKRVTAEETDQA